MKICLFAPFVSLNHNGQSTILGCGLISNEDTDIFVWLNMLNHFELQDHDWLNGL